MWIMKWVSRWMKGSRNVPAQPPTNLTPEEAKRALVDNANWWFYWQKEDRGWIFKAPVANPRDILHLNCGTGRWVIEAAVQFPQARVVGIGATLHDPTLSLGHGINHLPPNIEFIQGDICQPLPFADATFDFVFMGSLRAVVPAASWPALMQEIVRVMRPGGWVESILAISLLKNNTPGLGQIFEWIAERDRQQGKDPLIALKMPQLMKDSGLINVTTEEVLQSLRTPYDSRSRERRTISGSRVIAESRAGIIAAGITTAEEYDRVGELARSELSTNQQRAGNNTYDTFAQKPSS
jgi:ubiquinone/menaquinone biosynthesis C-methylase UbiE